MLAVIGVGSLDEMAAKALPAGILDALNSQGVAPGLETLPAPATEHQTLAELRALADSNTVAVSMIGQGYYDTLTPPVLLRNIVENHPRDELFQMSNDDLLATSLAILHLYDRPRVRLFERRDPYDRFASVLLYVPRERYDEVVSVAPSAASVARDGAPVALGADAATALARARGVIEEFS